MRRRSVHAASTARYRAFLERANASPSFAATVAPRDPALRPYRVAAFRYLKRLASAIRRK
jgi:hypothetical protein